MDLFASRTGNGDAATFEAVRAAARAGDFDRYLAALLAPRDVRGDLVTLAAFLGETARIPSLVSEPMQGEIRLQWWRDVIAAGTGARSGSPIADALNEMIARRALPRELFDRLLDARASDLYPDGFADEESLYAYLDDTEGAAFRLAARVLGGAGAQSAEGYEREAGGAFGLTRLLLSLPASLARGRMPLPRSWLGAAPEIPPGDVDALAAAPAVKAALQRATAAARDRLSAAREVDPAVPRRMRTAFLPLALVEPYLRALERSDHDPLRQLADLPPLTRVWRLWRAHIAGSI